MTASHQNQISETNGQACYGTTVLVVDDEPVNRLILCKLLYESGFATEQASNGADAIEAIKTNAIDMVLLDIVMPVMDGFATLNAIRNDLALKELPVIMVTSSGESENVVRALECGANDFINKPVDDAVTIARINMHLQFAKSRLDLRQSQERYALVAKGTNDGLWDWDLDSDIVFYSDRWFNMLAIEDRNANSPDTWFSRIHPEDRQRVENELEAHILGRNPHFETEMRMRHQNGSFRWTLCRGLAVVDSAGVAHRIAGSLTDITEGKVADALTGLPNRVLFHDRLGRCVQRQKRDPSFKFALLYLDLDNFKLINDSLGHAAGDRLLVAIARRLESSLREAESFVSRIGGDEFSILVEGYASDEEPIQVANRIIASVGSPISIGDSREVYTSVSVGVCFSKDGHAGSTEMIQAADTAMYRAKEQGKSCYRIFDPIMRQDATKRLNIEHELRKAIVNRQLQLHYQPLVDIKTSKIHGCEALVRWHHPKLGDISPAEFIPIAEDNGLIESIGLFVLKDACAQLVSWQQRNERFVDFEMSVNLSSRQLKSSSLVEDIRKVLAETKVDTANLKLEVTESAIMENPQRGGEVLAELQKLGIKVAIDDFGTGYSSLSCLHELSPDAVKIDRSFVDTLATSGDKKQIVKAIIALAEGLGLDVVAEGIETAAQHKILSEMGCRLAQGFLFSRPLTPADTYLLVTQSAVIPIVGGEMGLLLNQTVNQAMQD